MASSSETPTDGSSSEEREIYERACFEETRQQLEGVLRSGLELHELRDIRLEGSYPDTRIVVTLWDLRFEKEVSDSYEIWRDPTFHLPGHSRESPRTVGMLITTWILER